MVRGVLQDVRGGVAPGIISARFHNGLCDLLSDAAHQAGTENGLQRIALSGGVFQNATLSQRLEAALEKLGFEVHTHQQVPPMMDVSPWGRLISAASGCGTSNGSPPRAQRSQWEQPKTLVNHEAHEGHEEFNRRFHSIRVLRAFRGKSLIM